ncbi:MAG: hypothetical protein EPN43_04985 [Jatrophihabitans sp.]|nr:MAG: hypothetical protein EPN43_04985 [Jatrophihabitans sp.]
MRILIGLAALSMLGAVATAIAFWAGADQAGPFSFALLGFAVMISVPIIVGQLSNWGVPGDEPSWRSHSAH